MRLLFCGLLCGLMGTQMPFASSEAAAQRLHVGKYQSRALFQEAMRSDGRRRPAVILLPGSGAHGPEEMIPGHLTLDGEDHSIFAAFTEQLNSSGLHTLALGKPGVEFFSGWDNKTRFYDVEMLKNLRWSGYIENVREALRYLRSRADVDSEHIYLLGHSEGTQLAIDTVKTERGVRGLILLGFAGEDVATILEWQLFRRAIDKFVATDVDTNHDGFVDRAEAAKWPEFKFPWKTGQERVSFAELEAESRRDPRAIAVLEAFKKSPLYQDQRGGPFYEKAAALIQDLYVYTGALDVQTRPEEAEKLRETCLRVGKKNCVVTIVPGLGHGFSPPRPPRRHQLLDLTVGPVAPEFQAVLRDLGSRLAKAK